MSYLRLPPDPFCSKCGVPEEDSQWGILIDVTVTTSDSEEGYANITQLLCDECFPLMQRALMDLGFVDHRHGSINFLEDLTCCGGCQAYENCPTPTEYGSVVVTPTGPWQHESVL